MHELALCDAMLKMVRDISREQALEGVRSISPDEVLPTSGSTVVRSSSSTASTPTP